MSLSKYVGQNILLRAREFTTKGSRRSLVAASLCDQVAVTSPAPSSTPAGGRNSRRGNTTGIPHSTGSRRQYHQHRRADVNGQVRWVAVGLATCTGAVGEC